MPQSIKDLIAQARSAGMTPLVNDLEQTSSQLNDLSDVAGQMGHEAMLRYLQGLSSSAAAHSSEPSVFLDDSTRSLQAILDAKGWHYDCQTVAPQVRVFHLGFTHTVNSVKIGIPVRIFLEGLHRSCRISIPLDIVIGKPFIFPLCLSLAKINTHQPYGGFVYKEETSELAYEYTYPISGGLCEETFLNVFTSVFHSATQEEALNTIRMYASGHRLNEGKKEILENIHALNRELDDQSIDASARQE